MQEFAERSSWHLDEGSATQRGSAHTGPASKTDSSESTELPLSLMSRATEHNFHNSWDEIKRGKQTKAVASRLEAIVFNKVQIHSLRF